MNSTSIGFRDRMIAAAQARADQFSLTEVLDDQAGRELIIIIMLAEIQAVLKRPRNNPGRGNGEIGFMDAMKQRWFWVAVAAGVAFGSSGATGVINLLLGGGGGP